MFVNDNINYGRLALSLSMIALIMVASIKFVND